jgi:hypothetical protein
LWSIAKALQIPIDNRIEEIRDLPYTISYTIRKRMQIDNLSELPKAKRPTDEIIWDGSPEELDDWIDKMFKDPDSDKGISLSLAEIED